MGLLILLNQQFDLLLSCCNVVVTPGPCTVPHLKREERQKTQKENTTPSNLLTQFFEHRFYFSNGSIWHMFSIRPRLTSLLHWKYGRAVLQEKDNQEWKPPIQTASRKETQKNLAEKHQRWIRSREFQRPCTHVGDSCSGPRICQPFFEGNWKLSVVRAPLSLVLLSPKCDSRGNSLRFPKASPWQLWMFTQWPFLEPALKCCSPGGI